MKRTIGILECNYSGLGHGPLTESRPLASLPFHGRYRLVDFALSNMVNAGVTTVGLIMPTGYRSIVAHVGSGKEWGLARKRGGLFPTPGSPFGTARTGGRFLLRDLFANKPIFMRNNYDYVLFSTSAFVMNVDFDEMMEAHVASGAEITLLTQVVPEGKGDANVVRVCAEEGRVSGMALGSEAGDTAFLDAFIANRETVSKLASWYETKDHLDLFEAMEEDFDKVDVRTFGFDGYAAPVFTVDEYYGSSMDLLDPVVAASVFPEERCVKTKSHDSTPAKYEAGCAVSGSLVSSSCRIKGEVEGSVLGRHVIVEPGARVAGSVIMQGVRIKAGAVVENAIVDRNNTVEPGQVLKGTRENILYVAKSDDYRAGTDN